MPPLPPLQQPPDPPLSPTTAGDSPDDRLLKNIQGNILKSHGRDCTRFVLFWFDGAPGQQNPELRELFPDAVAAGLVTTAYQQWTDSEQAKAAWAAAHPGASPWPAPGSPETFGAAPFYSLAISLPGMKRCGYQRPDWPIQSNIDAGSGFGKPANQTFAQLGDASAPGNPSKPKWDGAYADGDGPDGMWLLAHDNKNNELAGMIQTVVNFLGAHGVHRTVVEAGFSWTDQAGNVREPFGFRDGLSQPLFFAADCEPTPSGPQVPTWVNIPRSQVLIEGTPHDGGSFFVLRKLAQDVAAFRAFEATINLNRLPAGAVAPKQPGALLVGRERDGTPLAALTGPGPADAPNEFDFGSDVARCPFHAHIRKSNPRLAAPPNNNLAALFARRGVVYDPHGRLPAVGALDPDHAGDYPEGASITATSEVGLLFVGYMSSIGDQFVRMQRDWFANPTFPVPGTSFGDPILQPLATGQSWSWQPVPSAPPVVAPVPANFSPVTPMGGAYFYVPSIAWLLQQ